MEFHLRGIHHCLRGSKSSSSHQSSKLSPWKKDFSCWRGREIERGLSIWPRRWIDGILNGEFLSLFFPVTDPFKRDGVKANLFSHSLKFIFKRLFLAVLTHFLQGWMWESICDIGLMTDLNFLGLRGNRIFLTSHSTIVFKSPSFFFGAKIAKSSSKTLAQSCKYSPTHCVWGIKVGESHSFLSVEYGRSGGSRYVPLPTLLPPLTVCKPQFQYLICPLLSHWQRVTSGEDENVDGRGRRKSHKFHEAPPSSSFGKFRIYDG